MGRGYGEDSLSVCKGMGGRTAQRGSATWLHSRVSKLRVRVRLEWGPEISLAARLKALQGLKIRI